MTLRYHSLGFHSGSFTCFFLTTNAAVTIEWEQATYSVREDGGLITACAQINGELCRDLEVTAQTVDLPPSQQAATSKCFHSCDNALLLFFNYVN